MLAPLNFANCGGQVRYSVLRTQYAAAACAAVLIVALLGPVDPLRADIFILENGGRIEGQWLNRDEQPLTKYMVRQGEATLALPVAQVREAIRQSPAEAEYAKRAPAVADTPQEQWDLAEWCRKNNLSAQRQAHLRRVIEIDPNHAQARLALGYQFLKGQWTTRSDFRREEGYEFYKGKWRTPQEIEILEEHGRGEIADKEWLQRLKRLRRELDDAGKSAAAAQALLAIKDPIAVRPIGEFFAREPARNVKALYSDVLANIHTADAVRILVGRAMADRDEEVFYYCLDKLVQLQPPHVADPFIAELKNNDNGRVCRAATALGRLRDKTATSPLIEAIVTTHQQVVDTGAGGDTAASFGTGGTFLRKGGGSELQVFHVQNQPVVDALNKLTGANFGFNQKAWRYWHAQEKRAAEAGQPVVDVRRQ